jgi:hypothetical protein
MYEDVDQYIIMRDAMLETFSSQKVSCHESCGVGIFFFDIFGSYTSSLDELLVQFAS